MLFFILLIKILIWLINFLILLIKGYLLKLFILSSDWYIFFVIFLIKDGNFWKRVMSFMIIFFRIWFLFMLMRLLIKLMVFLIGLIIL